MPATVPEVAMMYLCFAPEGVACFQTCDGISLI